MNRWAADLFKWECCMRAYWWSSLWLNFVRHSFHNESRSTKIKKMKYFVCFHREWLYSLRNASEQHYCDHFQWFRARSIAFAVHLDHIWESQIDFDLEQCSNSLKLLRKIPEELNTKKDGLNSIWGERIRRSSFSITYLLERIDSLRLERRNRINNITHDTDDSRDFSQYVITSTERSISSEHLRLSEEFIVFFFYHNHRRIIHIQSLVSKSFSLVQIFYFRNYNLLYFMREHFTRFSWFNWMRQSSFRHLNWISFDSSIISSLERFWQKNFYKHFRYASSQRSNRQFDYLRSRSSLESFESSSSNLLNIPQSGSWTKQHFAKRVTSSEYRQRSIEHSENFLCFDSAESELNDDFDQLSSSSQFFSLIDALFKILSALRKKFHRRSISLQSISLNYAIILENRHTVEYSQSIQHSQKTKNSISARKQEITTLSDDLSVMTKLTAKTSRTKEKFREIREETTNEKISRMNRIINTNLQEMLNVTMTADIAAVAAKISQSTS